MLIAACLLLPLAASSQGFHRYPVRSRNDRVHVYLHDGDRQTYRSSGPIVSLDDSSCFPYGCGGITGPFTNPDPDARKPENLTTCIYDATGTLLYEREINACPYKYVDANQFKMEQRKQEWLRKKEEISRQ